MASKNTPNVRKKTLIQSSVTINKNMNLKNVLAKRVGYLEKKSYEELVFLVDVPLEAEELILNGKEYQCDTKIFYEDSKHDSIRITVSIFEPRQLAPWWKFWKNVDSPILSDGFVVRKTSA